MQLSDPDAYYADRDVPHTAQGDIYAGIPFVHATLLTPAFEAAGARKRPDAREPDLGVVTSHEGLGVVLHYTCGITAQPEGTEGYSHEYRLMAPIVSLRPLKRWKLGNNELRKIRDGYSIQGFMYLPQIEPVIIDDPGESDDEWAGHAAALLYRPAPVSQTLLDQQPRIARLTSDATRILDAAIIQTYTPNNFDWTTLAEPDMSNGCRTPASDMSSPSDHSPGWIACPCTSRRRLPSSGLLVTRTAPCCRRRGRQRAAPEA